MFTLLTNSFSRNLVNLEAPVSLHLMHYNSIQRHQTLRVTAAMAAGVTRKIIAPEELVDLNKWLEVRQFVGVKKVREILSFKPISYRLSLKFAAKPLYFQRLLKLRSDRPA